MAADSHTRWRWRRSRAQPWGRIKGPVSQYWVELEPKQNGGVGENPLVSWSSCEFDLKEGRERGCDRRCVTSGCQILSTKFKTRLRGSASARGRLGDVSKRFSFLVWNFAYRRFEGGEF
uniref:(northern house mosquito) hypothetical protein n=1 Tax=Culex pipiens TaxID=7175 RepID=A0A8D8ILM2_CULPI